MLRISYWIFTISCAFLFLFHIWDVSFLNSSSLFHFHLLVANMFSLHIMRMLLLIGILKWGKISFRIAISKNLQRGVVLLYDAHTKWLFTLSVGIAIFLVILSVCTVVYWFIPLFRFAVAGAFLSYMLIIMPTPKGNPSGVRKKLNQSPEYWCPTIITP